MKRIILALVYFLPIFFVGSVVNAQNDAGTFSLFYEYNKNKDFISAVPYGWKVINSDPSPWLKYKIFPKMEEILWYMHDSSKVAEKDLKKFNDTVIYFYNKAIQYEPKLEGYYTARKAYVEETWMKTDPAQVIALYESAAAKDSVLDPFYIDRLGMLYIANAVDANDFKIKALDLYSKLADQYPDNPLWIQKMEGIAENIDELKDITKRAWDLEKENTEKAYKYSAVCIRAQDYESAKIPLEFLTKKAPDVVNYWKQLATVYEKLDQNDNAVRAYKKLIEMQPELRDNYLNLALVYKRMEQLSVSRTYLQKAMNADPNWDYPVIVEAQLYEQAARACDFDFMAKCVYLLAVNTYRRAASMGGQYSSAASDRVKALANSIPTKEDYFFRKIKSGDTIKIEGTCYAWIGKTVQAQ